MQPARETAASPYLHAQARRTRCFVACVCAVLNLENTVTQNSPAPAPAQATAPTQDGAVLMLNAGSSSLKFEVFDLAPTRLQCFLRGQIGDIGHQAHFMV